MSDALQRHIGRCYEARVMGRGKYDDALATFRSDVALSPALRSAALLEYGRLHDFFARIPEGEHRRCSASVENLKTLKDVLDA